MKTILNLAYGSNLHRTRVAARIDIVSVVDTVQLPGWGLRFHKQGGDNSGKCNLVQHADETAYGVIYEFSAADKIKLDAIEGPGYGDHALNIDGIGLVSVYLAKPTHIDDSLQPYDWYHRFVRDGAEHCGFPDHYLAHIDRTACWPDPDHERRAAALNLLAKRP